MTPSLLRQAASVANGQWSVTSYWTSSKFSVMQFCTEGGLAPSLQNWHLTWHYFLGPRETPAELCFCFMSWAVARSVPRLASMSTRKNMPSIPRLSIMSTGNKQTSSVSLDAILPTRAAQHLRGKFFSPFVFVKPRLALYMVVVFNIDSCTPSLLACLLKRLLTIRNTISITFGCPVSGLPP